MPDINSIVSVTISADTRTPTRAGFGTPLLLGYHANFPERRRRYNELSELETDGFTVNHPIYKMAQALLSQDPRPEEFVVGRLPAGFSQSVELTMTSAVEGEVVSFTVVSPDGTETDISYTIPAAATTTTVATAVAALVTAIADLTAAGAAAVVTADADNAGEMFFYKDLVNCEFKDVTADAGYDTELTALELVDSDWYCVLLDVNSEPNVDDVAAWVQTRKKIFIAQTQDDIERNGSSSLGAGLKTLSYDRTAVIWADTHEEYPACAWAGLGLPKDPGSITWAFKELVGVSAQAHTPTQISNLETAGINYYVEVNGLGFTLHGTMADGEYIDVTRFIDWLQARIQERILGLLANADKVPYTDASVDMFVAEILAQLEIGVARNGLVAGTLSASGPKVADVSAANRANRHLPDLKFGANLAGAVHKLTIRGTVTV